MHTLRFIISSILCFCFLELSAQEETLNKTKDLNKPPLLHSIRLGVDISKPIIGLLNDSQGLELVTDLNLTKKIFLAAEYGNTQKTIQETYFESTTKGNYFKIGLNYNIYKNWGPMSNEIYAGLRYGLSSFSHSLNSYTINQSGTYYDPITQTGNSFHDLSANWIEFQAGIKAETLKNLYIGVSVSFSKIIKQDQPENFKNIYIPGINSVFLNNSGVNFNYTISYKIPLFRK